MLTVIFPLVQVVINRLIYKNSGNRCALTQAHLSCACDEHSKDEF